MLDWFYFFQGGDVVAFVYGLTKFYFTGALSYIESLLSPRNEEDKKMPLQHTKVAVNNLSFLVGLFICKLFLRKYCNWYFSNHI